MFPRCLVIARFEFEDVGSKLIRTWEVYSDTQCWITSLMATNCGVYGVLRTGTVGVL